MPIYRLLKSDNKQQNRKRRREKTRDPLNTFLEHHFSCHTPKHSDNMYKKFSQMYENVALTPNTLLQRKWKNVGMDAT